MEWMVLAIIVGIAVLVVFVISRFVIFQALKFVGPDEMGVLVIFGEPKSFWDSGYHFSKRLVLGEKYFNCFLKRFPKKRYSLDFPARIVISKEDWYPSGEKEPPKGRGRHYGAQTLKVNSTIYLRFPREKGKEKEEHPLFEIYRSGVPTENEKLRNWTEGALIHALRVAFGKITWREVTEKLEEVTKGTYEVLADEEGVLVKSGFTKECIDLTITEVYPPPELEKAFPVVDTQRLEAEAAEFQAQQRSRETVGAVIEMMAQARGKKVSEIKKEIEKDKELKREFLDIAKDYIVREMGIKGGAYLDIRVSGAEGIERMILNALAAWKRMPTGGRSREREKGRESRRFPTKEEAEQSLKRAIKES